MGGAALSATCHRPRHPRTRGSRVGGVHDLVAGGEPQVSLVHHLDLLTGHQRRPPGAIHRERRIRRGGPTRSDRAFHIVDENINRHARSFPIDHLAKPKVHLNPVNLR